MMTALYTVPAPETDRFLVPTRLAIARAVEDCNDGIKEVLHRELAILFRAIVHTRETVPDLEE